MRELLTFDPHTRITAPAALSHKCPRLLAFAAHRRSGVLCVQAAGSMRQRALQTQQGFLVRQLYVSL